MLQFENLSKTYTKNGQTLTALNDINLKIEPGCIFGIIGQSGAGKSTLLRCANRLETPSEGRVWVDGVNILDLSPKALMAQRHAIGMIFQHFNLLQNRTVAQNIAFPLELIGMPKHEQSTRIDELLAITQIADKRDTFPSELSGGQKQRVAIARALAANPKILLCDEATSALDPSSTENILSLLERINDEMGLTIMLITHEMDVVKRICDKVAIMHQGQIVEQNDLITLFTAPNTAQGRHFVDSCLGMQVPKAIENMMQTQSSEIVLLRIVFTAHAEDEAIISRLQKTHDIEMNILQANIERIHHASLGIMFVTMINDKSKIERALHFFSAHQIQAERIGYVNITLD